MKMQLEIGLKELERQFSSCIRCKRCTYGSYPKNLAVCPMYDRNKFFTYCAGGILYLGRAIHMGLIEKADYGEILEVIGKCTSCGYCGEACKLVEVAPPYQDVTDLIGHLKMDLVKKGVFLSEGHKEAIDRVKKLRSPFPVSGEEKERFSSFKNRVPNKGKVLIFPGCAASYKTVENLDSLIDILSKAKINYHITDHTWCCGSPLFDLGEVNGITEVAEHNLEAIKGIGVNQVVFLCPHCQNTFQKIYPQLIKTELDFECISITKYLKELIDKKLLKPSKPLSQKIAYHDPCYSGRHLGDFEYAREIFGKIPQINLVEMERNREDAYCCGAGGGARILDSANSMAICKERMKDFKKTGAEVLVTSCPHCKSQFRDVSNGNGSGMVVKDVVEILKEAL
jgi:heterodisulfide reductase subunit D